MTLVSSSFPPSATADAHAMRRGGARREAADRVRLVGANLKHREGWALNKSRGGLRVILEEEVSVGETYEVTVGDADAGEDVARIVWVQHEPDGVIAGLEFVFDASRDDPSASLPPPPVSTRGGEGA
jgi:hypothetical protein